MGHSLGIFGLGLIGTALAERLISADYPVVGFDPDAARMDLLTSIGGNGADPKDVWQSDVVVTAVFDTDQLGTLIASAPKGDNRILVSVSTCDPERMDDLEAQAKAKNWRLVEAPISGTSLQLAKGDAVLLTAGEGEAVAELSQLFDSLGKSHFNLGAIGNGNRAKLAINLILGLNRAALAEGLVFAESLGLDPKEFLTLAQSSAAQSQVMATKGPLMVEKTFAPQGRVSQSIKDFNIVRKLALSKGQHLPFAGTYLEMLENCVENAETDFDNSAIILAIARSRADS